MILSLFFGLMGCQTNDAPQLSNSIKQLTDNQYGTTVNLDSVVVSSPVLHYGFFVSDPVAGPQSGIWVYTEGKSDVQYGEQISLSGVFEEYTHPTSGWYTEQIHLHAVTDVLARNVHVEPYTVQVEELHTTMANSLLSTLIRIEDVEITDPDFGPGEWQIEDTIVVDDLFYQADSFVAENHFSSVSGILIHNHGAHKLVPRDARDLQGHEQSCIGDRCAWELQYGELVIQEFMPNPFNDGACSDQDGEYIELRYIPEDPFAGSLDLAGLVIADENNRFQIKESVEVFPNQIIWLSMGQRSCYGSPVAHLGNRITLNNDGDVISLHVRSPFGEEKLIDDVYYDGTVVTEGVALQLAGDYTTAEDNDSMHVWCESQHRIEYSSDMGSPGLANHSCK